MIYAFLIVGSGEGDRYLEQTLSQLWTDEIAVCLNRADLHTEAIVRKYATIVRTDDREWGKNQWRIKQDFLDSLPIKDGDWVWCLDADEIFPTFTKEKALSLIDGNDIAYHFWCIQLWNTPERVRLDLCFPNVRFYKYVKNMNPHFEPQPLHCGLAPRYAYTFASQSDQHFLHYGLMTFEERERKRERYKKYDPKEKYIGKSWYGALRNENPRTVTLEEALARLPETIRRKKEIAVRNKLDKIFFFKNPHGRIVPAVGERQRDQFRKLGYAFLEDFVSETKPEAPVVKSEPKAEAKKSRKKKNETPLP